METTKEHKGSGLHMSDMCSLIERRQTHVSHETLSTHTRQADMRCRMSIPYYGKTHGNSEHSEYRGQGSTCDGCAADAAMLLKVIWKAT